VDDLAAACLHLMALDNPPDWVNVGTGEDLTILDLARLVAKTIGFTGDILTDPSKPDGTPRKLLDISRIRATGWQPAVSFRDGLSAAYQDFKASIAAGGARL
jgi:GDP-L-fucose synthase